MQILVFTRQVVTSASIMAGSSFSAMCVLLLCSSLNPSLALVTDDKGNDISAQLIFPTARDRGLKPSRLSSLLTMKHSMSRLMEHQPLERDVGVVMNVPREENEEFPGGVQKRVFCNGFTGCGGRFRGRRVQRQRRIPKRTKKSVSKRPFCNTYGCYNGGKRSEYPFTRITIDKVVRDIKEANRARHPTLDIFKRLFCNSRGCQNVKRSSTLPLLLAKGIPGPYLPEREPSWLEHDKRFFAGGFDNSMESFVNDLKRNSIPVTDVKDTGDAMDTGYIM